MKRTEIAKQAREILMEGTAMPLSKMARAADVNLSNLRRVLLPDYAEESPALIEQDYLRRLASALREEAKRATDAARGLEALDQKARREGGWEEAALE